MASRWSPGQCSWASGLDTRMDRVISVPATVPTDYVTQIADFAGAHPADWFLQRLLRSGRGLDPQPGCARCASKPVDLERPNPLRGPSLRNLRCCLSDDWRPSANADPDLRRGGRLLSPTARGPDEAGVACYRLFDDGTSGRKWHPMPASALALEAMHAASCSASSSTTVIRVLFPLAGPL